MSFILSVEFVAKSYFAEIEREEEIVRVIPILDFKKIAQETMYRADRNPLRTSHRRKSVEHLIENR